MRTQVHQRPGFMAWWHRLNLALAESRAMISDYAEASALFVRDDAIMVIDDHINLQTGSPLQGLSDPAFGPRFVDMSAPYDLGLMQTIRAVASEQGLALHTGVYASVTGPNLETRAEYRFLRIIGADMVGMSTVPEVIVANQVGLPCAAISVITDECDPDNLKSVNIAEIIAAANSADEGLSQLLAAVVEKIN